MRTFTVSFHCMIETESMEEAVRQAVAEILSHVVRKEPIPFTVEDADSGERKLIYWESHFKEPDSDKAD